MLRAAPVAGSKNVKFGGAYISCWVNYPHEEGALVLAKHYVRGAGWRCRSVLDRKWVRRSDYSKHDSLKYYNEAAKDGSSFVFHNYPKRGQEQFDKPLKSDARKNARAL